MTLWNRFRFWLRAVLFRGRMEREMDAELRFHVEAFAEDLVRGGSATGRGASTCAHGVWRR